MSQLTQVRDEIGAMLIRLEELQDWAESLEYPAIEHKIMEARGPLSSAFQAADQYQSGVLA